MDWFYKIVQDKSKVRTYREWAEAWLDGSEWKRSFVAANPGNNYMEIDNYYVKALIGWNRESGNGQIGEAELEKAKEVLQKFDVVRYSTFFINHSIKNRYYFSINDINFKIFTNNIIDINYIIVR